MTEEELRRAKLIQDMHRLPEDKRIDLIGHYVMDHKDTVAVLVDSGPGDVDKADRYIRKLQEKFPGIRIYPITSGPVKNTVCIRVGPPVD